MGSVVHDGLTFLDLIWKKWTWEDVRNSGKPKATQGSDLCSATQGNMVGFTCRPVAKVFLVVTRRLMLMY